MAKEIRTGQRPDTNQYIPHVQCILFLQKSTRDDVINPDCFAILKSVNLQYIMLGCLDDGTNKSSTKSLMFQVLFVLYFL